MSAAKRVAHAAETVRARWERQVSTDPQTEAAQALEDTGQLLDSEVAAELVAFRKERELADEVERAYTFDTAALKRRIAELLDERHSTNESVSKADEALRVQRDRIAELEMGIAWRDAERDRWAGVRYLVEKAIDKGWSSVDRFDLEDALGPEVAPVLAESVAEPSCLCPLAEVPRLSERPVNELTQSFAPVAALREALSREEPHDSPLHQAHRVPHDLPTPDGDRLLGGDELRRALRGHLFGGGA